MNMQEKPEKTLDQTLEAQLQLPVKNKEGAVMKNEDGTPMTVVQAVSMGLLQQAMKGDMEAVRLLEEQKRAQEILALRKELFGV